MMLNRLARGAVAGAVGTLAMDLLLWRRARRAGSTAPFKEWELSTGTTSFDEVGAPAAVGRRLAELVGHGIPERHAGATNDAVHWATGVQWGVQYGAATSALGTTSPLLGLVLGPVAWATAYAALAPVGIYRPIWDYDRRTLIDDLTAHLVFGLATASALRLLAGRRPAPT